MTGTHRRGLRLSLLWLLFHAAPAMAGGWGGAVGVATTYFYRGIALSGNSASLQADVHYSADTGWFGGAGASTIRLNPERNETAEIDAYVGRDWSFTPSWNARLTATHYQHPDTGLENEYNYDELMATLAYRDVLYLSASALPDLSFQSTRGYASNKPAFAYDATVNRPLWRMISARGGLGYFDVHRLFGVGYVYGNGGLAADFGSMHVDVSYIFTNASAKGLYPVAARNRWTADILWHF
jgi:uncharacterized protein (TIGR02001 family)